MTDDTTARFALPLLATGQAQKELTHNEALTRLDLLVHGKVTSVGDDAPPAAPEPGACWIVGNAPTGAWEEHAGEVAGWTEGGWRFVVPREGLRLWIDASAGFALFTDGAWRVGEAHGRLIVGGKQVVGARGAAIMEPEGGTTVDAEARAAIGAVLLAMRVHGLIEAE